MQESQECTPEVSWSLDGEGEGDGNRGDLDRKEDCSASRLSRGVGEREREEGGTLQQNQRLEDVVEGPQEGEEREGEDKEQPRSARKQKASQGGKGGARTRVSGLSLAGTEAEVSCDGSDQLAARSDQATRSEPRSSSRRQQRRGHRLAAAGEGAGVGLGAGGQHAQEAEAGAGAAMDNLQALANIAELIGQQQGGGEGEEEARAEGGGGLRVVATFEPNSRRSGSASPSHHAEASALSVPAQTYRPCAARTLTHTTDPSLSQQLPGEARKGMAMEWPRAYIIPPDRVFSPASFQKKVIPPDRVFSPASFKKKSSHLTGSFCLPISNEKAIPPHWDF